MFIIPGAKGAVKVVFPRTLQGGSDYVRICKGTSLGFAIGSNYVRIRNGMSYLAGRVKSKLHGKIDHIWRPFILSDLVGAQRFIWFPFATPYQSELQCESIWGGREDAPAGRSP